ncbi:MAG: hypothetical protein KDD44_08110, partial [Bdellovibrionales bacterium]|nr:hypothetical protein [Bdellovibrionales bacterium]
WIWIALRIGWVVTNIVLAFTFFIIIAPLGVVMRLFGKQPLEHCLLDSERESYWIQREPVHDPAHYEREF